MTLFKYIKDSYRTIVFFFLLLLIIDLILISSSDLDKSLLDIFYLNLLHFSIFLIFLAIDYTKVEKHLWGLKKGYRPKGEC